jgi:hypothetical protein
MQRFNQPGQEVGKKHPSWLLLPLLLLPHLLPKQVVKLGELLLT